MKFFKTHGGPFVERPYYTDDEIEAICLDELGRQDLLPSSPSPVRIERFVEKKFKVTVEPAELQDGVLGLTKFAASGVQSMFVSAAIERDQSAAARRRVRSTIAHEAGHGLLHAYLFALPAGKPLFGDLSEPGSPKVLCRDEVVDLGRRSYGGEWWEYQANAAMGHLLMPRPLLQQACLPFLVPFGTLGGKRIDPDRYHSGVRSLADIFDVNPVVARIRLEALYSAKEDKQLAL